MHNHAGCLYDTDFTVIRIRYLLKRFQQPSVMIGLESIGIIAPGA